MGASPRLNPGASRMSHDVDVQLRHALASHFGLVEPLPDELSLDELLLGATDLDEIAVVVESEFGIAIPDFAFERIRCLGDLVRVVRVCSWAAGRGRSVPSIRDAA